MFERLILVRHGQTLDNIRGVAQGWNDSDLSELGREQAKKLASRLRDLAPTSIYSSTLPRALKTARIIADELGLDIEEIDDLKEISCGDWEGVSFDEVRRTQPELFRAWIGDPGVRCPGGESFADVLIRVERAMEAIAELERASSRKKSMPLIVSHGLAIRILATGLLRIPLASARNFLQDNAAMNVFEWRVDRFVLRHWNDISHHTTAGSQ